MLGLLANVARSVHKARKGETAQMGWASRANQARLARKVSQESLDQQEHGERPGNGVKPDRLENGGQKDQLVLLDHQDRKAPKVNED